MAGRILSRPKILALALPCFHASRNSASARAAAAAAVFADNGFITSLAPVDTRWHSPEIPKILGFKISGYKCDKALTRCFSTKADFGVAKHGAQNAQEPEILEPIAGLGHPYPLNTKPASAKVIASSPLEATVVKERKSVLPRESSKIKRAELANKVTYALIPSLLLVSTNSLMTSAMIACVYCQVYWFYKEIFLDYVHHEITRTWVLIYFKLLLLLLAKDTIIYFNLI